MTLFKNIKWYWSVGTYRVRELHVPDKTTACLTSHDCEQRRIYVDQRIHFKAKDPVAQKKSWS